MRITRGSEPRRPPCAAGGCRSAGSPRGPQRRRPAARRDGRAAVSKAPSPHSTPPTSPARPTPPSSPGATARVARSGGQRRGQPVGHGQPHVPRTGHLPRHRHRHGDRQPGKRGLGLGNGHRRRVRHNSDADADRRDPRSAVRRPRGDVTDAYVGLSAGDYTATVSLGDGTTQGARSSPTRRELTSSPRCRPPGFGHRTSRSPSREPGPRPSAAVTVAAPVVASVVGPLTGAIDPATNTGTSPVSRRSTSRPSWARRTGLARHRRGPAGRPGPVHGPRPGDHRRLGELAPDRRHLTRRRVRCGPGQPAGQPPGAARPAGARRPARGGHGLTPRPFRRARPRRRERRRHVPRHAQRHESRNLLDPTLYAFTLHGRFRATRSSSRRCPPRRWRRRTRSPSPSTSKAPLGCSSDGPVRPSRSAR